MMKIFPSPTQAPRKFTEMPGGGSGAGRLVGGKSLFDNDEDE